MLESILHLAIVEHKRSEIDFHKSKALKGSELKICHLLGFLVPYLYFSIGAFLPENLTKTWTQQCID